MDAYRVMKKLPLLHAKFLKAKEALETAIVQKWPAGKSVCFRHAGGRNRTQTAISTGIALDDDLVVESARGKQYRVHWTRIREEKK